MRPNRSSLLAVALAIALVVPLTHSAVAVAGPTGTPASPDSLQTPPSPDSDRPDQLVSSVSSLDDASLAMPVVNQSETSNYLAIADGDVVRSTYGNASLDVAGALSASATELRHTFESIGWQRSFERAQTDEQRVSLVRNETRRIEAEIATLQRRQASLVDAYNADEMTTRALFRELAALDTAARELERRLVSLRSTAANTIGFRLPTALVTRITNSRAELVPLRGNVRDRLGEAIAGQHGTVTAYAATSANGVVLATNTDRLFLREAYLGDRRRPGQPDQFDDGSLPRISAANQRAAELYPWVYSIPAPPSVSAFGDTSLYNVSDTHPHGRIHTYLDGATRDSYREFQWKPLDRLPTQPLTGTNGSLQLQANRTHVTGPMQLTVRDVATNETVDATVAINGATVGRTGDDGTLWAITPHDQVEIRVETTAGDVVTLSFQARE